MHNLLSSKENLRSHLVETALSWQARFGVAPAITAALSELDAALLLGMSEDDYSLDCSHRTAVTKGHDFSYLGCRYQVKANRPSGRPGSPVTLVAKVNNYEWDRLIWILYDRCYVLQEAWEADAALSQARLIIDDRLLRLDSVTRPGRFTLDDSRRISDLVGLGKFTAKDRFGEVAERFLGAAAAPFRPIHKLSAAEPVPEALRNYKFMGH